CHALCRGRIAARAPGPGTSTPGRRSSPDRSRGGGRAKLRAQLRRGASGHQAGEHLAGCRPRRRGGFRHRPTYRGAKRPSVARAILPADRFMSAARFAEALGTPVTVAIAVGTAQAMLHDITVARSVAVLPFENMSADPENEYFSDGVTDDIISTLSKIAALKVVCRTSTMQYTKTRKRIAAIAATLGVATIIDGSGRRAGPQVRFIARP